MINFDALHKAKKTKFILLREAPNIKLWKVVPYDSKQYYIIIKTINADNSITIIKDKFAKHHKVGNTFISRRKNNDNRRKTRY